MAQERISEDKKGKVTKPKVTEKPDKRHDPGGTPRAADLTSLQQQVGNQAVQRLLVQRSGEGPFELDDAVAGRINRERGGGQPLDSGVQEKMAGTMGQEFDDVRVHHSPEADQLNQQLGAKAFTTGQDVFFREGAYEPHTSSGQELIAHELTHVVQQRTGQVGDSGGMTVNAPGDVFEQEADAVAKSATGPGATAEVQRQGEEKDELMRQEETEEEEMLEEAAAPEELMEEEETAV